MLTMDDLIDWAEGQILTFSAMMGRVDSPDSAPNPTRKNAELRRALWVYTQRIKIGQSIPAEKMSMNLLKILSSRGFTTAYMRGMLDSVLMALSDHATYNEQ